MIEFEQSQIGACISILVASLNIDVLTNLGMADGNGATVVDISLSEALQKARRA
jgi:hypothetical protein